ncbi:MAG: hypothetical protein LIO90_02835, partial [Bacteroidales bacterium]|nr:hypothetical protein [Bacteroidales bacterium]
MGAKSAQHCTLPNGSTAPVASAPQLRWPPLCGLDGSWAPKAPNTVPCLTAPQPRWPRLRSPDGLRAPQPRWPSLCGPDGPLGAERGPCVSRGTVLGGFAAEITGGFAVEILFFNLYYYLNMSSSTRPSYW